MIIVLVHFKRAAALQVVMLACVDSVAMGGEDVAHNVQSLVGSLLKLANVGQLT